MKIKVPFNYLPFQFKNSKIYFNEWKKLIKSCEFTLGPFVQKFEKSFAEYIGSKYCFSTNNGTDALILSLKAIGIKNNDEVITVSNSFYATTGAIVACGAKPVFVDSDNRYQIDVSQIKSAITKKTKAILPVHWGGASPDMKAIIKIAKKYKLKVVEDACMGIGGKIYNKSPGTFGDIGAFSMHPLKSLNVMGDGGAIVTNNKKIAKWIEKYRNHGMINRDKISIWGVNMRMQPLQAIVAKIELKKVDRIIKQRNKNALFLDQKLSNINEIILPERVSKFTETFSLYMARFKKRDQLKSFLLKSGIEVKVHYPLPLHLQIPSKNFGYKNKNFPNSELQSKDLLTLPVHQYLTKNQLNYIVNKIRLFYKK